MGVVACVGEDAVGGVLGRPCWSRRTTETGGHDVLPAVFVVEVDVLGIRGDKTELLVANTRRDSGNCSPEFRSGAAKLGHIEAAWVRSLGRGV